MNHTINLHPMVVHFPIVLLLLALVFEVVFLINKAEFYEKATGLMLTLAAISALVALYFGFRAADILGHDSPFHDYVHVHRDIMEWFTGLTVGFAILFQFVKSARKGIFRLIALLILTIILVIGTDRGAELVFHYGMGVSVPDHEMMMHEQHHDHHDMDDDGDDHEAESHHTHTQLDGSQHNH